ncbi:putative protein EI24 -like protein [Capsicum annuum]|nr:putative protein EI24 -like protein [Capsicum annuum]
MVEDAAEVIWLGCVFGGVMIADKVGVEGAAAIGEVTRAIIELTVKKTVGAANFDESAIVGYLMSLGLFGNAMVGYLVRVQGFHALCAVLAVATVDTSVVKLWLPASLMGSQAAGLNRTMVLEALLAPGSELWMFNEVPEKDREKKLTDGGLDISGLENIKLVHHVGNAVIRRHLEGLPLETFDSDILARVMKRDLIGMAGTLGLGFLELTHESLHDSWTDSMYRGSLDGFCNSSESTARVDSTDRGLPSMTRAVSHDESVEDSIVHSDSRSLATLLLIRDIQSKRLPNKDSRPIPLRHSVFSQSSWIREMQQASDRSIIISEILDSRTRNLVSVSRISDYVLSNELVSMALAMVAEDKQINRVLEELFAEEGNELCIKPAEFYLYEQEELCFYEIMRRGRQRREIVIGYRIAAAERAVINPAGKSKQRKWSLDDVFVVISSGD